VPTKSTGTVNKNYGYRYRCQKLATLFHLANVFFKNTTIGVSAGFNGEFSIEVDTPGDTLVASAIGYYHAYVRIKKGVFQKVEFQLNPSEFNLNEVEIFAEANPALIIFNRMIKNKPKNNPKEFEFLNTGSIIRLKLTLIMLMIVLKKPIIKET